MYCSNCGKLLGVTDKFCSECGTARGTTPLPNKENQPIPNMTAFFTMGYVPMRAFMYYTLMDIANKNNKK